MNDLTGTTGIVALAGCGVAALAFLWCVVLAVKLRRLRSDQSAVLGTTSRDDLVAHAAGLQREFGVLHQYVDDMARGLEARMGTAENRLDGAVAHSALVRYDAYGEMSGRQSTSIALLDSRATGIVLSSIHHRDSARLYAKHVVEGRGELELSPEEQEAVRLALGGAAPREVATGS